MSGVVRPRFVPPPYQDSAEAGRLILRDGTTAHIRPARPADRDALSDFFWSLSPESRFRRFLSLAVPGGELLARLCGCSDPHDGLTLLATRERGGRSWVIATGSYLARGPRTAEVALAVADEFHGKGLGT